MPILPSPLSSPIHIGQLIESELRRQQRSVAWFAREIYTTRQNAYNIFRKEDIDLSLLIRISNVLNHDFLLEVSSLLSLDN